MIRIPLAPRQKKPPLVSEWQRLPAESPAWKAAAEAVPGCNWGLRMDGMTVIDADCPEAVQWWLGFGPITDFRTTARHQLERCHFWYRGEVPAGRWRLPDGTAGGEIKSGPGHYVVVPPSIHPNGQPYRWLGPELIDPDQLPDMAPSFIDRLRSRALVASVGEGEEWDTLPEGDRNQGLTVIAGFLRRHGASEAALVVALRALNEALCVPRIGEPEVSSIARSVANYATAGPGWGGAMGREIFIDDEENEGGPLVS